MLSFVYETLKIALEYAPRACTLNHFTAVSVTVSEKARVFFNAGHLYPSLLAACKAGAH
jgi:hypothetical protein